MSETDERAKASEEDDIGPLDERVWKALREQLTLLERRWASAEHFPDEEIYWLALRTALIRLEAVTSNLQNLQGRCTTLLEENRRLKVRLTEALAQAIK